MPSLLLTALFVVGLRVWRPAAITCACVDGAAGRLLRNFFLNLLDAVRSAALPEPVDGCGAMLLMWDTLPTPVLSLGLSSWTALQHRRLFTSS